MGNLDDELFEAVSPEETCECFFQALEDSSDCFEGDPGLLSGMASEEVLKNAFCGWVDGFTRTSGWIVDKEESFRLVKERYASLSKRA
jgi:hypothetical protein